VPTQCASEPWSTEPFSVESTATAVGRPPRCPDTRPRLQLTARSAQSRPIGRARPRVNAVGTRRHAQICKACERGERARHTPRQLVVAKVAAKPTHTWPSRAVQYLSGTTAPY
jgi:hypothetical protein